MDFRHSLWHTLGRVDYGVPVGGVGRAHPLWPAAESPGSGLQGLWGFSRGTETVLVSSEHQDQNPVKQNAADGDHRGGTVSRKRVPAAKKLLGQLLILEGLIEPHQLEAALTKQQSTGKRLGDTLEEMGFLKHSEFEQFISRQPGVASIDLHHYSIPVEVVRTIPRDFAVANQIFPIDKLGKLLTVAMVCPLDSRSIKELQDMTGLRVKALRCTVGAIAACIREYYKLSDVPKSPR